MITIKLDFVGLFLFDNRFPDQKRVAVIDADREGVIHPPHPDPLKRHEARFTVLDGTPSFCDWPSTDGKYVLGGDITFAAAGAIDTKNWDLPKFEAGCENFRMDPGYFDQPRQDQTHAVIHLHAGRFGSWRFPGENGAFNTRVTFEVERFSMFGGIRHIAFEQHGSLLFQNTELVPAEDDDLSDWLWYYNATGNSCFARPNGEGIRSPCDPLNIKPFTLGCSNSQWP